MIECQFANDRSQFGWVVVVHINTGGAIWETFMHCTAGASLEDFLCRPFSA